MHRLLYVHNSFIRSVVISYIFLCTPDNSMIQYFFHWLFLHSDSGTTENMFFTFNHIVQGLQHFACTIHWDGGTS